MVRRATNNVELRLARSQATVIIHNLMPELTTFVTKSLGGATGEGDTMITEVPEEHRHIRTTVHAQAEDYARMQYKEMQAGLLAERRGQRSECGTAGTASSIAEAAAATLGTLRGLQDQAALPVVDYSR